MGKKDKKKGKGIEKTAIKTEKNLSAKQKKLLAKLGEDDIEKIVSQIEEEERKRLEVKEILLDKPNRRTNFAFVAHPTKDELFLFGGEFYNGQKTLVYNDLMSFNIIKKTWTLIQAPGGPPPRCGHQMISSPTNKGQLWVFGGEFTSATESQFHHYRDLWVFHIGEKRWEKVNAPGGPSARSGHRMVTNKKQIIIFGGYNENLGEYKYFNDVHIFDLETYKWTKLEPSGIPPAPRSGTQLVPLKDGKVLVHGGYSKEKVKKDVDRGVAHTDSFLLTPEKNDFTGLKWKWSQVKLGGMKPSQRTGSTIIVSPSLDKAYSFGGVYDLEESEEDVSGKFYNDLNILDLERRTWRQGVLCPKKDSQSSIRRRRRKQDDEENEEEPDDNDDENMEIETTEEQITTVVTDGVFTMTVGPAPEVQSSSNDGIQATSSNAFTPSPRMSVGLAIKHGTLYLYGGTFEDGDKEITFADLYALDIHKMDEWKTVAKDEEAEKEWVDVNSDDDDDQDDEDDEDDEEDSDTDSDDSQQCNQDMEVAE